MLPHLNITIKELMSTEVVTVKRLDLMINVKEILEVNGFHHVPVVDEQNKLVGIISKHDFNKMLTTFSVFKNSKAEVANKKFMMSLMAKDVMTKDVAKLHPDDSLSVAVGIFKENLFHALPIVDNENRVVGILSTYDLLNYAFDDKRMLEV